MRVLFLTHRLPYPPNRGDRIRAYHLLQTLREFAEVDLVSLVHDDQEAASADALRANGGVVEIARVSRVRNLAKAVLGLPGRVPLTHALLESPTMSPLLRRLVATRPPDVVLYFCSGVAVQAERAPLKGVPFVLDMVDVDSAKWASLGETARGPMRAIYRREARTLRAFEQRIMDQATATTVVSERERVEARSVNPRARIEVVSNGVDLEYFTPRGQTARTASVVFCGVFNYEPNELGAIWLAKEVWPLVTRERPDARLRLVGMHPTARVRALAADPTVEVTGAVPDTRPYLWGASVAVAPLHIARGIQNKVLEAVAAGLPCVVTPQVFDGLPASIRGACHVAATTHEFSQAIRDKLRAMTESRTVFVDRDDLDTLSWRSQLSPTRALLEDALRRI